MSTVTTEAEKARRNARHGAFVVFLLGIVMLLVGGTLLFDQIGPSVRRDAVVTGKDIEKTRRSKGGTDTDYVVRGRDDHGGVFEVNVSKGEYSDVDRGERIVIERSLLTGRVVRISGPDWALGRRGLVTGMYAGLTVIGAVSLSLRLRSHLRTDWSERRSERRHRIIAGSAVTAVVAIGLGIWVQMERADASLGGSEVAPPLTSAISCEHLDPVVRSALSVRLLDGSFTSDDMTIAEIAIRAVEPDCDMLQIRSAICRVVRSHAPGIGATPVRIDLGVCPGP